MEKTLSTSPCSQYPLQDLFYGQDPLQIFYMEKALSRSSVGKRPLPSLVYRKKHFQVVSIENIFSWNLYGKDLHVFFYGQELFKVFSMDLTLSRSSLWKIPSPGLVYGQ